jgi:hypothetical protein
MKRISEFIIEKLKVSSNKQSNTIDSQMFFDALFDYCKSKSVPGVTALDVYTDFNDIPEIIVERYQTRKRTNFALHPTGQTEIVNVEVWLYTKSNEPEELLTNIKANESAFNFLKEVILGTKVINDIYNYVEQ